MNKLRKPSYRGRDVGTERSGSVSWPSVRPELEVSAFYDSYDVLLAKGLSLKLQSKGSKVPAPIWSSEVVRKLKKL